MELINAYQEMIKVNGWNGTSGFLGMTKTALENRVYEKGGQSVSVDTALLIQSHSKTTLFAETIAQLSGGTFIKLPPAKEIGNVSLLGKFNELHAKIGRLSAEFAQDTEDDEIDDRERARLEAISGEIHQTMEEFMALTFRIYCKPKAK